MAFISTLGGLCTLKNVLSLIVKSLNPLFQYMKLRHCISSFPTPVLYIATNFFFFIIFLFTVPSQQLMEFATKMNSIRLKFNLPLASIKYLFKAFASKYFKAMSIQTRFSKFFILSTQLSDYIQTSS